MRYVASFSVVAEHAPKRSGVRLRHFSFVPRMSQTTMLSQPRRFSAQTSARPMKPAPPVTRTRDSEKSFGFILLFWQWRQCQPKKTSPLIKCKYPTGSIRIIFIISILERKYIITNHNALFLSQNRLNQILIVILNHIRRPFLKTIFITHKSFIPVGNSVLFKLVEKALHYSCHDSP